ncbi:MAG: thioredoxin domain-containing protein [Deltaproteobacteria bacterium]|nr:thioredoxin domain-containing protein [Deltaproteobacteria bacterium]
MRRGVLLFVLMAQALAPTPAHSRSELGPSPRRSVVAEVRSLSDAPATGPKHAPVTVEVFCAHLYRQCRDVYRVLAELSKRHPTRLRVVYRLIALNFQDAALFAEAALEAWAQGRFLEFQKLVHEQQGALARKDLERLASQAGLDMAAVRTALADQRHRPQLEYNDLWATRLGVDRTPALVWNGRLRATAIHVDAYEQLYDEAHAEARKLLDRGVAATRLYPVLLRRSSRQGGEHALDSTPANSPTSQATGNIDLHAPRVTIALGGAPSRGPEGAEVTILVFSDFQCAYCAYLQRSLRRAEEAYAGHVRLVYKHFPMASNTESRLAAEAAACAQLQGQFWPFHDRLFQAPTRLSRSALLRVAADIGLEPGRFLEDLETGRCAEQVDADIAQAKTLGVVQAPTLFVNGLRLPGTRNFEDLRLILDEELRPGLLEALTSRLPD